MFRSIISESFLDRLKRRLLRVDQLVTLKMYQVITNKGFCSNFKNYNNLRQYVILLVVEELQYDFESMDERQKEGLTEAVSKYVKEKYGEKFSYFWSLKCQ